MGRRSNNKSEARSIAFEPGTEFKEYQVTLPNAYLVTIENNDPNNLVKTSSPLEFTLNPGSTLEKLIKEIEGGFANFKNPKVVKADKATRPMTELCPKCHDLKCEKCNWRGTPQIQKKDANYSIKLTNRYDQSNEMRNQDGSIDHRIKKEPEYWYTWVHNKHHKCRISQYIIDKYPSYKKNKNRIEEHFFPNFVVNMKEGSLKVKQDI